MPIEPPDQIHPLVLELGQILPLSYHLTVEEEFTRVPVSFSVLTHVVIHHGSPWLKYALAFFTHSFLRSVSWDPAVEKQIPRVPVSFSVLTHVVIHHGSPWLKYALMSSRMLPSWRPTLPLVRLSPLSEALLQDLLARPACRLNSARRCGPTKIFVATAK